ncbi:MAG: hypothetical protein WC678_01555 [Parcubacteria group bacterium]|jgi:hypothetical protein
MSDYDLFLVDSNLDVATIIHRAIDKKYDVYSTLHRATVNGQITETLYRVIKRKRERYKPLPADHIKEIERRIIRPLKRATKGTLTFQVSKKGLKIEEITETQAKYNRWCGLAWSAYD